MVCIELHRTPVTAGIMALAAALCSGTSLSQMASFDADREQQLVDTIGAIQAQDGAYAAELLDPLRALALLYRESGEHALATVAIEQALQVTRANHGLHSLEQAQLLREQVLNEQERGNVEKAWRAEGELLDLLTRHPDDLRTVPMLREIADKRLAVLDRYLEGQAPPQLILGCYYDTIQHDGVDICHSGSRRAAVNNVLNDAWNQYQRAIRVLLRNGLYSSDELRDLEMQLIRSSFVHGGYGVGRASLRRLIAYEVTTAAPASKQLDALVQLADWDLLFLSNRGVPLELYELVHEHLTTQAGGGEAIERIFAPDVPVVLPTFLPNPLVPDETENHAGYVDVVFALTKFGESRDIEIRGASADATDEAKRRLVRLISRSRFRPRVTGGEFTRTAPIAVRYYLPD